SADQQIADVAVSPAAVAKLWEVCQVPDYRKISSQNHAELVATLYKFLMGTEERIPADWFASQVALADRTDGDIDTLANRIAHIRTWTFVSNRTDWLADPEHWQGRTREIEDSLSDALHEQLTQRFVDKRTSALMRGLRDKQDLNAEIGADGAIRVENHYVGRLKGFRFSPDAQGQAEGIHGKAARNAAAHVLAKELAMRARRVAAAKSDAFKLTRHARVLWREEEIARLEAGEDPLKPSIHILCDDHLSGPDKEKTQSRLEAWLTEIIGERLKPLMDLAADQEIVGLARGIAFRLSESFGIVKREGVAEEIRTLEQQARAQLRRHGVRFGAFNIYLPVLLKPAAAELTLVLWALKHGGKNGLSLDSLPEPPRAGLTSIPADLSLPEAFYRAAGYHLCGPRAIRIDMLERLADLIRPLLAWRVESASEPPKGASGDGGFTVIPEMMSILGCSSGELSEVLKTLGFRVERKPVLSPQSTAPANAADRAVDVVPSQLPAVEDQTSVEKEGLALDSAHAAVVSPHATLESDIEQPLTAQPAPTEVAAASALPELPKDIVDEPKVIEVWRPHRRARGDREQKGPPRRDTGEGSGEREARQRPHRDQRPDRRGRPDRRRDEDQRRKGDEHPRPDVRSAAPQRRGGVDPDSPFAALGALKSALEKRAKEQGTT
ncbi:MAG: helicase, partial [Hyphomicrobiaceae bacterium]